MKRHIITLLVLLHASLLWSQQWQFIEPMRDPRILFGFCQLDSGKVLIAGGDSRSFPQQLRSTEIYDPRTDRWTIAGDLNKRRSGAPLVKLHDGRLFIPSGCDSTSRMTLTSELFDPVTQTWSMTTPLLQPRYGESAIVLPNGKVLIVGGWDLGTMTYHATCELFDPATSTVTHTGDISQWQTGAMLFLDTPRNKVIMISDRFSVGPTGTWLTATEEYDIASGTWTVTAHSQFPHGTYSQQSVQLPNGDILAPSGGSHGGRADSVIEIYRPTTKQWKIINEIPFARWQGVTVYIGNDSALLIGGYHPAVNEVLTDCRFINTRTGQVTKGPSLQISRAYHRASVHTTIDPIDPNVEVTTVYVFGGMTMPGIYTPTCEKLEFRRQKTSSWVAGNSGEQKFIKASYDPFHEQLVCIDNMAADRKIELVNALGQVVFSKEMSGSDHRVEVSAVGLPAGLYIFKAATRTTVLSAKVLVNR